MFSRRMKMAVAGAAAGSGGPIFLDTFTDTNGTNITDHTPDIGGGTWVVNTGSASIQSNKISITTNGTVVRNDIGLTGGFTATVEYTTPSSVSVHSGLLIRVGTGNNNLVLVGHGDNSTAFIIGYRSAGSLQISATTAFTWNGSTTYTLALTIDGSSGIVATINGGNQISATVAQLTSNIHIGLKAQNGGVFDNLQVT